MNAMKAVVQKVIREGKHGPFAVATSDQLEGSVTFSLEPTVWEEEEWPEEGMVVLLGDLRQKRAGWRAKKGRFWKPSDEQAQHAERSRKMTQFLYPRIRQFPFDGICGRIVRELEKRNWEVPGIQTEFYEYGSGAQRFRIVSVIKGRDFRLFFSRSQGSVPGDRWNDTAAVSRMVIPRKELHVYEDESGPTFYLYAGNDYERDREKFMKGLKVNSKLRGEPKMYLQYDGGCDCRMDGGASFRAAGFLMATLMDDAEKLSQITHTHPGRRSPLLVHTNDLGREYDPEGDEPKVLRTDAVMEEFKKYFEEIVLKMIVACPIPEKRIEMFVEPDPIPFPESVGSLFCFCEYGEAARIAQGKADPEKLHPSDRFGLSVGCRLISLGTPNDGTVPEIAYEGFVWCGIGEVKKTTPIESLKIPGHYRWSDSERFVIRVKPNRANDIYIADHFQYEKRRQDIASTIKGRDMFTNSEIADFTRARARTIIPISEYQGQYKMPVVLVGRELSFDEVEIVTGPRKDCFGR